MLTQTKMQARSDLKQLEYLVSGYTNKFLSPESAPSDIVYIDASDSNRVKVKNCVSGKIISDGTDADVGIQAAITDAGSSGGIIYIKRGTYSIDTTLAINNPLILMGEGRGRTNITMSANDAIFDYLTNASKVVVEEMTLTGNYVPGTTDYLSSDGFNVSVGTGHVFRELEINKCINAWNLTGDRWNLFMENCYIGTSAGNGCGRVLLHTDGDANNGGNFTLHHVWGDKFVHVQVWSVDHYEEAANYAVVEIGRQNAPRLIGCDFMSPTRDGIWVKRGNVGILLAVNTAIDNAERYAVRIEDTAGVPETIRHIDFSNCWLKTTSSADAAVRIVKAERIGFRGGITLGTDFNVYADTVNDMTIDMLHLANINNAAQAGADCIRLNACNGCSVLGMIRVDGANGLNSAVDETGASNDNIFIPTIRGTVTSYIPTVGTRTISMYRDGAASQLWVTALKPFTDNTGVVGDATHTYSDGRFTNFTIDSTLTVVDVAATGVYKVDGTQVVSNQGAAIADASGGATVDAEARTAINTLLARLRTHGLIAT